MKRRLLIISPYFPPANTADMQRVRMSLPYFNEFGWEAEVVAVSPDYVDLAKDDLLNESLPGTVKIHWVKALGKKWTSRFGFGSISYRSYPFIKKAVNQLLRREKFDLVYFSTTQFQVCTLGPYWKRKFKVPYVIDMQDPWHSEYYRDKPKHQQPPKYWLSYRLNKYLEPKAMKHVDGLVSVSESYIATLQNRYPHLSEKPSAVITFGAFAPDQQIAADHAGDFPKLLNPATKNIVYIGRGGMDMYKAIKPVFEVLQAEKDTFKGLHFYFIGTSYAPAGQAEATILPLAKAYGVEEMVTELPGRIGYYHTLNTLQQADALFVPGSDDPAYTASKIYPYLLTAKPLLAIFTAHSPANTVLQEYGVKNAFCYDETPQLAQKISTFLRGVANGDLMAEAYNAAAIEKYSARMMARRQCDLFNKVKLSAR